MTPLAFINRVGDGATRSRVASITSATMLSADTLIEEPLEDRIECRTAVSCRRISSTTNGLGNSVAKSSNAGCVSSSSTLGNARSNWLMLSVGDWFRSDNSRLLELR